jgi:hypothetical protein
MLLRHALAPTLAALTVALAPLSLYAQAPGAEDRAVRRVIETAYVTGVFVTRDTAAVRAGFHPDFVLSVLQDDRVLVVSLDRWLGHLKLDGRRSTDTVEHRFERVDVTGNTATVKLQLFVNGEHEYTDYFGLYRFSDGWKIVTKVFASHD